MKQTIGIAVLALAALMAATPAEAQSGGRRQRLAERMMDRRMAQLKQELKLTPEQEPALRSIMRDTAKQTRELRKKYGTQDPEFKKELRAMHDATQEKLKGVLQEDQLVKFRELRQKRLERIR